MSKTESTVSDRSLPRRCAPVHEVKSAVAGFMTELPAFGPISNPTSTQEEKLTMLERKPWGRPRRPVLAGGCR